VSADNLASSGADRDDTVPSQGARECFSCGFETDALKSYRRYDRDDAWLCALCASTMAGRAQKYPDQFPNRDVLQTICYVGNVILEALRRAPETGAASADKTSPEANA
jgi:hypothetical protein